MRRFPALVLTLVLLHAFAAWPQTSNPQCSASDGLPVAVNDAFPWPSGTVLLNVLGNDHDPDGGALKVFSTQNAVGGVAQIAQNGALVSFTPATGATTGSFGYTIIDPAGSKASATVTLGIDSPLPPPPVAPTADFSFHCTGALCAFNIAASTPGDVRSTEWTFGDNSVSPAGLRTLTTTHEYATSPQFQSGQVTSQTFTTSLKVTWVSGQSVTRTKSVTITRVAERVDFRVLTTGSGIGGLRVRAKVLSTNLASVAAIGLWRYFIDWGDGSPLLPMVPASGLNDPTNAESSPHVYASPGTYRVTFIARLPQVRDVSFFEFVTVTNIPPRPSFTAAIQSDLVTVEFDPSTSDDDVHPGFSQSHTWDFGDGEQQQGQIELTPAPRLAKVTHVYRSPGTYVVKLSIVDQFGEIGTASKTVRIENQAPTASFFAQCTGRRCVFNAAASVDDGTITSYSWEFGDGTQTMTDIPVAGWEYANDGCYTVRLTVVDDGGRSAKAQRTYPLSGVLTRKAGAAVVDAHYQSRSKSNLNGILEPGETVMLETVMANPLNEPTRWPGTLQSFTGTAPGTFEMVDREAAFDAGPLATGDCWTGLDSECYYIRLGAPSVRPALHWDATVTETTPVGQGTYTIHIGKSFTDVAVSSPFYPFIEALLHNGISSGCGNNQYCPGTVVPREQAAPFLLLSLAKATNTTITPPACVNPGPFGDVPCSNPFSAWIGELKRRGITSGCGNGNFCPSAPLTRAMLATLVLRTLEPSFVPTQCGPMFTDLPCTDSAAPYVEELVRRGAIAGCAPGKFCPGDPVTREQMAVFLVAGFRLPSSVTVCAPGAVPEPTTQSAAAAADSEQEEEH